MVLEGVDETEAGVVVRVRGKGRPQCPACFGSRVLTRDTSDLYLTRRQFQEEQYQEALQSTPRPGLNREEVGGYDQFPMARQKLLPTGLLFPLRCRLDPVSLENASNRATGHRVPQIR
jgi:hypothetical protein